MGSRFEANSYGFRAGTLHDGCDRGPIATLSQPGSSGWVLDADISGCFDHIGQEPLLARLPVFTTTIRRWLKAGVVELGHYTATEAGTPQGGSASRPCWRMSHWTGWNACWSRMAKRQTESPMLSQRTRQGDQFDPLCG